METEFEFLKDLFTLILKIKKFKNLKKENNKANKLKIQN